MAGNVSLLNYGEGGGILSDAIVTLRDPRFIMGDYGGKSQVAVPMLRLPMVEIGEGGDELEHVQLFSVGGAKDFIPDDTGLGLVKVGTKDAIVKNSNFAVFMQSIIDAGFPPEKTIDNDISWINGIKCHVTRKAVTREGMADQKKDATVLVVDKLYLDEKGAAKKGVGKAAAGKATAAPAKAELDEGLVEEAKAILMEVLLGEDSGPLAKNKLMPAALAVLKGNPNLRGIIGILVKDEFLTLCDGWQYEGGVLTVG